MYVCSRERVCVFWDSACDATCWICFGIMFNLFSLGACNRDFPLSLSYIPDHTVMSFDFHDDDDDDDT